MGARRLALAPSGAPDRDPSTTASVGQSGTWPVSALPRNPAEAAAAVMASEVPMPSLTGTRRTPISTGTRRKAPPAPTSPGGDPDGPRTADRGDPVERFRVAPFCTTRSRGGHEHQRQRDRGHRREDGQDEVPAHVARGDAADQRSEGHRRPAHERQPAVDHGHSSMGEGADQGRRENLRHRDSRDLLDVEGAHGEERRDVEQERNHHDGAADADQPGDEGPDETECDQGQDEADRHREMCPRERPATGGSSSRRRGRRRSRRRSCASGPSPPRATDPPDCAGPP